MTIRVVAAAAALVLGVATVAAPAMAEPRTVPAPATTTTESVDTASTPSGTKAKRQTRYCAETEITGSRLPRRQCQTREDWLRDGVDPLDYLPR